MKTGDNFGVKNYVFLSETEQNSFIKFTAKDHKSFIFKIKNFSLHKDFNISKFE